MDFKVMEKETKKILVVGGGFGGIGGTYIKFTALANARKFYELFDNADCFDPITI